MKEKLVGSVSNGGRYEDEQLNGNSGKEEKWEDAVPVVKANEEIIKTEEKYY